MIYELNLGMFEGTTETLTPFARIKEALRSDAVRIVSVGYIPPSKENDEPTLWVQFIANTRNAHDYALALAKHLGQLAVPFRAVNAVHGYMAIPDLCKVNPEWRTFAPEYFQGAEKTAFLLSPSKYL